MRVTTIGTGTAAPHPARAQAATLIEVGDVRLLLDCGSAAVLRMAERGLPWQDITHVAITHFHADHTTDLANLIYAWHYGQLPPRTHPIDLIGPPGFATLVEAMKPVFGADLLQRPFPVTVTELPAGEQKELAEDVRLEPFKVPHTDESVAY